LLRKPQICSKGAPYKRKSEHCFNVGHDRGIGLPLCFSYFLNQCFVYLAMFWCHPATCCENKGLNEDFSMPISLLFGCVYPPYLFHVVNRSVIKAFLEYDSEVRCVILMSKNVFLQLFHSPLAECYSNLFI